MLALIIILFCFSPAWATAGEGQWWYKQAQLLYQEGDLSRALALLQEIPKRFPKDQALVVKASVLAAKILYQQGRYDQVLALLKPLLRQTILPAPGLLVLAQSAEKKGLYDEALMYVSLLRKHYPQSARCEATLIEARIFAKRHLKDRTKSLSKKVLQGPCTLPLKAEALELILQNGGKIDRYLSFIKAHPRLRYYRPEIIRELALYHLRQGELKKAEAEIYQYLNYSGNEKAAPELLFDLAEAYFVRKRYREARRIYELVFTSWPSSQEATFAKFRLYHMRYLFEEKIGHKTAYTRRLLLAICKRLKKDFPKAPITEEAHALEIKLLLENRQPEEALKSIWGFLKCYPHSRYLPQVYEALCQAVSPVDQKFLAGKDYLGLIFFHNEHRKALAAAGCGLHYYWLSQAYQGLNLDGSALLALLQARDFGVPRPWQPNLYLNLVDLLLTQGGPEDLPLVADLLSQVAQEFSEVSSSPYFLFLKGWCSLRKKDFATAVSLLKQAFTRTADEKLKARIRGFYLESLLKSGALAQALSLLKTEKSPKPVYLKRLVLLALSQDKPDLAAQGSALLLKWEPEDTEALWLRALVLERLGEESQAQKIWATLAQKGATTPSPFVKLASGLVRASELIAQARRELY